MDRKAAAEKLMSLQAMIEGYMKKGTAASERYVGTSRGNIRVLEYGFDTRDKRPLYVDIHGGGWALLFPEFDEKINLQILEKTNVRIISMDYPKAPKNPYPAGIEAVYEVIKHYYENAEEYGIDRSNVGVGGYSSGGNFATVACIMAKERKDFKIKYQVMCYPGTDAAEGAYIKPKSEHGITNEDIEAFELCYVEDPKDAKLPYVSPVYATKEQLTGLPPALMIIAGPGDPLSPEDLRYAKNLREAGVPLEQYEFERAYHGFMQNDEPDAEEAIGILIDFIKKHTE